MRILHRYIFVELARVFLLALTAFTSIFVIIGLVQEATQQGLNPLQILCMVPFVVPASLPYTIPATLLLAVTVVYGRLAADNEITATKAAGINVLYLIVPALIIGLALSLLTTFLHDRVIPLANMRMRAVLVTNVEDVVYAALRRDHVLKGSSGVPYEIYVQRVEGRLLINTTFKRRVQQGGYDLIVFAQKATLEFDLQNQMVNVMLFNAEVTDGKGTRIEIGQDKTFPIGLPNFGNVSPGIRDLTIRDIEDRMADVRRVQATDCGRWVFRSLTPISSGRLAEVPWGSLEGVADRGRDAQRKVWRLALEPHMRRAISFGCLAFVLLGCPVAILFQRGDYLSAFISCFLPIICIYYPLLMFVFNMSKEGYWPPIVMWGGNIFLVALSIVVFRPVLRH
jgi:lipopolysaccharide export system permease protein